VVAVDTLVAGVHFPDQAGAEDVGHKALAVNLSDLAAMGAAPLGYGVALTLSAADPAWLEGFGDGLSALARTHGIPRIAARRGLGPLAVTVEAYGSVPAGAALRRSGARPGDAVYATGTLGDAALALAALQGRVRLPPPALAEVAPRLHRPQPRVAIGQGLRGLASAAIDVSDGLAADLGHVLAASGVGARLELARLPLSAALAGALEPGAAWALALGGGDDYELCFTAAPSLEAQLRAAAARTGCPVTRIGRIEAEPGLRCLDPAGRAHPAPRGFDHFAAPGAGRDP
jgi:thiamine-monophosphate kinase